MWKRRKIKWFNPLRRFGDRSLTKDRGGAVAVEFAIILPILLALILGLVDVGMGFFAKIELASAVRAGVQYAAISSIDPDTTGDSTKIETVVHGSSGLGTDITVTSRSFCGCSSTGIEEVCSDPVSAGCNRRNYVEVKGVYEFTPMFLSLAGLRQIVPLPELADTLDFEEIVAFRTD